MISVMEVEQNSLIMSLLAPDVTINGQPALSVGVKIEAVEACSRPNAAEVRPSGCARRARR